MKKTIVISIGVIAAIVIMIMVSVFFRVRHVTQLEDRVIEVPDKFFAEKDMRDVSSMQDEVSGTAVKRGDIMMTGGVRHTVPLDKILSGGPPKDGIPSIDDPKFVTVQEADKYLDDAGLGIAVSFGGVDRFYPNQILVWHEIVNDTVGGQSVLVSYCPLCGTGVVFDPMVKGRPTQFGISGKLYQSNLVMYDRQTDSYWSQVLGESILGEMAGTKLELLPHLNLLYKDWKKDHARGQVLSRDTGFFRDYSRSPYRGYENNRAIFFPVDNEDDRFHPKMPVLGLEDDGHFKAYPIEELDKATGSFTDRFDGRTVRVIYDKGKKTATFTDTATKEELVPVYGFWFSWFSVHPDTDVYEARAAN